MFLEVQDCCLLLQRSEGSPYHLLHPSQEMNAVRYARLVLRAESKKTYLQETLRTKQGKNLGGCQ